MYIVRLRYIFLLALMTVSMTLMPPAAAATVPPPQETNLYEFGHAGSIHVGVDETLFVIDDDLELWKVNPQTGAYRDYYPIGGDNLADIALTPGNALWWSDSATNFGALNLEPDTLHSWSIDIEDYGDEPLQLGPLTYFDNKLWLASWYGPTYGLFRLGNFSPQPSSPELCLYDYPSGLFAADLAVHDGLLWMLDWSSNSLLGMNPTNGRLVKYATGRDIREKANLQSDGSLLWWPEDRLNGALVSFDPKSKEMKIYSLPVGTHPRNVSLRRGKVWYSDANGTFGSLDPNQVSGQPTTLIEQVLASTITPGCQTLGQPNEQNASFETGTFAWTDVNITRDTSHTGFDIYSLPAQAAPFGIAGVSNFILVTDSGRQKLIRMGMEQAYITVNKVVINDNDGTASVNDFDLKLDSIPVTSGELTAVDPGTYTAGESLLPGYRFTGFSSDCDENGNITVAADKTKTCTLTNDDEVLVYLPLLRK